MSVETSRPDAILRVVGARCERCDFRWDEAELFDREPIRASFLSFGFFHASSTHPGYESGRRWPRDGECAGRLLLATEPYEEAQP